jgi:hypothetical protein
MDVTERQRVSFSMPAMWAPAAQFEIPGEACRNLSSGQPHYKLGITGQRVVKATD